MKRTMIILSACFLVGACHDKAEEKTAAASATQPVVIEKVKYVPVHSASEATSQNNKVGWSKAAKGTVIGAAGGALVGASVSGGKDKAKGAVIGGIVGAGTGYAIGRGDDKKDGRVKPKN